MAAIEVFFQSELDFLAVQSAAAVHDGRYRVCVTYRVLWNVCLQWMCVRSGLPGCILLEVKSSDLNCDVKFQGPNNWQGVYKITHV